MPLNVRPSVDSWRAVVSFHGVRRDASEPTDEIDEPSEIAKKVKHVAKLLESAGVAYSEDLAAAWIAPFNDEADPLFTIEQWLKAGWRDPRLVAAAMSIFGNLERAQWCMEQLGVDSASLYRLQLVRLMLEAHEVLQRAS